MKRVLVTGGSGFLGAWIIRRFTARCIGVRVFDIYANRQTVAAIAGPSLACCAAVQGGPYTIDYTGCSGLIYADDVAQAFVAALQFYRAQVAL